MPLQHENDSEARFYLRLMVEDRPHVLADICDALGRNSISIASVVQKELDDPAPANGPSIVPLVIMTHKTTVGRIRAAEARFAELGSVRPGHCRLPVADL